MITPDSMDECKEAKRQRCEADFNYELIKALDNICEVLESIDETLKQNRN